MAWRLAQMVYVLGFLMATAAGWWVAAADALFRAEDKPPIFRGNAGMVLLLAVTGAGGMVFAGAAIWLMRISPSASVFVLMAIGGWFGVWASNKLNVTAAGANNRMIVGLVGMVALYAVAWSYFPPP